MKIYVIGDLQGCAHEAQLLLDRIDTDAHGEERLIFVGDLVNRGPDSLGALRRIKALQEAGKAEALLGNHDLHLVAVAAGAQARSHADTLDEILDAPDCDELMAWLRARPLAVMHDGCLMVHAGVLPQWSATRTLELAGEVQDVLRGEQYGDFLREMYGNQPDRWDDSLTGFARLRCIVNALTRMRLCAPDGTMDFKVKESAGAPDGSGLLPWFDLPGRATEDTTVVFGHWSALGLLLRPNLIGVDSGCVWGGKLSAVRLDTRQVIQVACPEYREHAGKRSVAPA
ncbi:symmetrical bis(5'-nucleosyl)-tetraphosphatase [Pseudoduganella sp. GCM10020061]|uniref:symmetrical bis(5'-nucleosyl)-tetraphosphatase n=1 Tax=Pseudoduganella sp. GCM10020061 TaxID=3317345 RepID=UPI0036363BF6